MIDDTYKYKQEKQILQKPIKKQGCKKTRVEISSVLPNVIVTIQPYHTRYICIINEEQTNVKCFSILSVVSKETGK